MRTVAIVLALAAALLPVTAPVMAADDVPAPLREGYPAAITGLIYQDAATKVIIYVETDGRHVAAISPDGKLLWRKDPFVDAKMQPYRLARPTISSIGPAASILGGSTASGQFAIHFTSSQMGLMSLATGQFRFMGQN
jgi:hypothetical protein